MSTYPEIPVPYLIDLLRPAYRALLDADDLVGGIDASATAAEVRDLLRQIASIRRLAETIETSLTTPAATVTQITSTASAA